MTKEELEQMEVTINTSLKVHRPFYNLYVNHIKDLELLDKTEAVEYLQHLFFEMYKNHSITVDDLLDNVGIGIKFKNNKNEN